MNYKKVYDSLITSRKHRGLDKSNFIGEYLEKHHIIPRCLGGTDDESNFVLLTAKEHVLAHLLLHEIYPDNVGLASAAFLISKDKSGKKTSLRISSRLREEYGNLQKKRNDIIRETSKDGFVLSEETRLKMSKSRLGRVVKEEVKAKISRTESGKIVSEITRKKLSESYQDTKEKRRKLSEASKKLMSDPLNRKRISDTLKGKSESQNTRGIRITDGERVFNSLGECARFHNMTVKALKDLLSDSNSSFKITSLPKTRLKIIGPDGTVYNSLLECSTKTRHSKQTIRRWISKYPEKGYKLLN